MLACSPAVLLATSQLDANLSLIPDGAAVKFSGHDTLGYDDNYNQKIKAMSLFVQHLTA